MKVYKNIGGTHMQDGIVYPCGSIIKTNKPLDKMFKNHFERVDPRVADLETGAATEVPDVEETDNTTNDETEANTNAETMAELTERYGKDVTTEFPDAATAGVLVFKQKGYFALIDTDDNKQLGGKLRKKAVQAAIEEYLPEDEDEDDDEE